MWLDSVLVKWQKFGQILFLVYHFYEVCKSLCCIVVEVVAIVIIKLLKLTKVHVGALKWFSCRQSLIEVAHRATWL